MLKRSQSNRKKFIDRRNKKYEKKKEKIDKIAFKYLIEKRGRKCSEIEYFSLRMTDHHEPSTTGLTISENQEMISVKNRWFK